MKTQRRLIRFMLIVALVCGGVIWWQILPSHRKEFFKNLARQVKFLPDRYMA